MTPWSFVGTVAGEDDVGCRDGIALDCMGLTNFTDEVAGTAVFVTMMGGRGLPVPWARLA